MEVLALVVSLLAIAIAAIGAKYAGDQARATRSQLALLQAQAHEARAPRLTGRFVERIHAQVPGKHAILQFTNNGPVDLTEIDVYVEGHGRLSAAQVDGPSNKVTLPVGTQRSYLPAGLAFVTQSCRVTCFAEDGSRWVVPVTCDIVPAPSPLWRPPGAGQMGAIGGYGPMGGAGAGSGDRHPETWLVEDEDVWGTSDSEPGPVIE
jgi:hypothetical protein